MVDNDALLKYFAKEYGHQRLMTGDSLPAIERFKTGIAPIDVVYGGGIPKGRCIEIYGPESVGKSTLALNIIAAAQRDNQLCCYMDLEGTLEDSHCRAAGVSLSDLIVTNPLCGDDAFDMLKDIVQKFGVTVVVLDSLPLLLPKSDYEKTLDDASARYVGGVASMLSRMSPVLREFGKEYGLTTIFLNQVRAKIGGMGGIDTPGGHARRHLMSHRLYITHATKEGEEEKKLGPGIIRSHMRVEKSKVGGAGMRCSIQIERGSINKELALLDLSKDLGLVSGGWYKVSSEIEELTGFSGNLGQGKYNAIKKLEESPEIAAVLYEQCLRKSSYSTEEDELLVSEEVGD